MHTGQLSAEGVRALGRIMNNLDELRLTSSHSVIIKSGVNTAEPSNRISFALFQKRGEPPTLI